VSDIQDTGPASKSSTGPQVVGLGYCAYDILAITTGAPEFDALHQPPHLTDLVIDGGGQVGTALSCLARLGATTGYVGLLGDDPEGRWLRDAFVQSGVDLSRLQISADVGTNICLLLVEEHTGRRAILCHRRVHPKDLVLSQTDRPYIQQARVLHLDGQFMPAALQAAHWMKQAGGIVCFDGNHNRPGLDELLPLVDWLVVSEGFPALVSGCDDMEKAAHSLLALGPRLLVVTQAERGCQVWTREEKFSDPGFSVPVVDTTGAGDAFHGGWIYAMLQGWDVARAAAFANAVAALNCQTLGGRRGLPTLAQVQALLLSR
jgi:sugar/nucleoside kinase (ribokinase family)